MQFANLVDSGVCKKLLSSNFHVRFNKTASTLVILSTAFISFHFYELKWCMRVCVCEPPPNRMRFHFPFNSSGTGTSTRHRAFQMMNFYVILRHNRKQIYIFFRLRSAHMQHKYIIFLISFSLPFLVAI